MKSIDDRWWLLEPNDDDRCDDMWGHNEDDEDDEDDEDEDEDKPEPPCAMTLAKAKKENKIE